MQKYGSTRRVFLYLLRSISKFRMDRVFYMRDKRAQRSIYEVVSIFLAFFLVFAAYQCSQWASFIYVDWYMWKNETAVDKKGFLCIFLNTIFICWPTDSLRLDRLDVIVSFSQEYCIYTQSGCENVRELVLQKHVNHISVNQFLESSILEAIEPSVFG